MVNLGLNWMTILGIVDVGLAIAYLVTAILNAGMRSRIIGGLGITLYIIQGLMAIVILPIGGFILVFNGWRVDPILATQQLLLHLLLIYLAFKDALIFGIVSRQSQR
ncbi:hypothetical protein [Tychonema sp. BBK16]|uniref:hypothetical protein n=1 Tax=Tychonema sp. BBK16 TaxID=2699888 RepID=UPI001F177A7F|nr:hypothetical protein [Tychonema sp. BBK16]MCF6372037.1 hypothetical protein [Tychonema sp. BBK16]